MKSCVAVTKWASKDSTTCYGYAILCVNKKESRTEAFCPTDGLWYDINGAVKRDCIYHERKQAKTQLRQLMNNILYKRQPLFLITLGGWRESTKDE